MLGNEAGWNANPRVILGESLAVPARAAQAPQQAQGRELVSSCEDMAS